MMKSTMLLRALRRSTNPSIVGGFGKSCEWKNAGSMETRITSMPMRWMSSEAPVMHGTTILSVRKGEKVVIIGDGQCTMGSIVIKPTARKVRRIGPDGKIVAGFAGATADAFTLLERLETKIEEHPGQLLRACVSLAKDWRMDKFLRRLDSMLVVCDANVSLMVNGGGDVIEPEEGVLAVGSGGSYATAAALALLDVDGFDAEQIAKKSMEIAANMCIYTNHNFVTEVIDSKEGKLAEAAEAAKAEKPKETKQKAEKADKSKKS